MKIEIDEEEVYNLPNDVELGKYVRSKINNAREVQNSKWVKYKDGIITINKKINWYFTTSSIFLNNKDDKL